MSASHKDSISSVVVILLAGWSENANEVIGVTEEIKSLHPVILQLFHDKLQLFIRH